jgi:hypothetical protein
LLSNLSRVSGVYPPGWLVGMTNGAIAIVIECNEKIKLRPKIIIILGEEKNMWMSKSLIYLKCSKINRGMAILLKELSELKIGTLIPANIIEKVFYIKLFL